LKMIGFSFYFPIFQIRCFSLLKKANFIWTRSLRNSKIFAYMSIIFPLLKEV
jgi:hypothetical protein